MTSFPLLTATGILLLLVSGLVLGARCRSLTKALEEEKRRYRTLVDNSAVGIYRTTPDGRILIANPALISILGYSSFEELASRNLEGDSFEPSYPREAFRAQMARDNEVLGLEVEWTRRDGSVIFVRESAKLMRDADGQPAYYDGTVEDITERKRAEEALVESEQRFRTTFEAGGAGMALVDAEGRPWRSNPALQRMLGYSEEELSRMAFTEFTHREDRERDWQLYHNLMEGHLERYGVEKRYITKDGKVVWGLLTVSVVNDLHGRPQYAVAMVEDITVQKEAAQALTREKAFTEAIIDGLPDIFYVLNESRHCLRWNKNAEKVLGYSQEEASRMDAVDFVAPEDRVTVAARMAEALSKGSAVVELRLLTKNGRRIPYILTTTRAVIGNEVYIVGIGIDITDREQAEEALIKLRQAVDASGEVVFMTDPQGLITFINHEFTSLYGYSEAEVVGKVTPRVLKSEAPGQMDYEKFWMAILDKQVTRMELTNKTKTGRTVIVDTSVSPILDDAGNITGFLAIQRDVTGRRQLETQLRQSQKMEAIGLLAGGVAHDFNNLLTIISGYGQLLLEELNGADPGYVHEILKASERAAALIRQLLAFSRRQILAPQVLDLNSVVTNLESILRRLIGEDIEFGTILAPDLGMIKADPGQIEQVLVNLSVNARDAMPHGGLLTIATANVDLNAAYAESHPGVTPGPHVMLNVTDTGHGIDSETMLHIFEPFFTTKEKGKGTGLGLSTVYGIVQQSSGSIWVYSEPGHGTTFKVYLPRLDEPVSRVETVEECEAPAIGSETVLVVEDEEGVRSLVCATLKSMGYRVIEASGPIEAISLIEQREEPVHMLLTDVVMPQMSGKELADRLSAMNAGAKVLFMSGYTDDSVVRHGILDASTFFLQKPFTPDALARKVRDVLDHRNE